MSKGLTDALLYRNVAYRGTTDSGMGASTTNIDCADFIGFGDDYFNTGWYMQIIHNNNSVGNAPEGEVRDITDFDDGTGEFIVDAFTTNVEAADEIIILHESLVAIGRNDGNNVFDSSNVSGNADGSALERLEQLAVDVAAVDAPVSTASATTTGTIVEDSAAGTGTPDITQVDTSASDNTFGSWVELDASASADSWICAITVNIGGAQANDCNIVVEIGTGTATSEATKIRFSFRFEYDGSVGSKMPIVYPVIVPIKVASGTRIAARASASDPTGVGVMPTFIGIQYYQGLET